MRLITFSIALVLMLVTSSCVPSLQPLYSERDLVLDRALLGQWMESKPDSKSTLTFIEHGDNEYKLISTDDKETSTYLAHLVKLGDKLFLDISGDPSVNCQTLSMPVHMFFLVSQTKPSLKLRDLDDKWLENYLKKNPAALKHQIVDKDLILTASTEELQRFVLQHVNTRGAFTDPVEYVRKK